MKTALLAMGMLFVLVVCGPVSAEDKGNGVNLGKQPSFEEVKANVIGSIDGRIKILQDDRKCVSSAKTREDLKKCRQQDLEKRKELRQQRQKNKQTNSGVSP